VGEPRALALSIEFAAAQEVALANDADKRTVGVDNRKAADAVVEHEPGRFGDRGRSIHSDRRRGHYSLNEHYYPLAWCAAPLRRSASELCGFYRVRCGAGALSIGLAGDMQLLNQFSTKYQPPRHVALINLKFSRRSFRSSFDDQYEVREADPPTG